MPIVMKGTQFGGRFDRFETREEAQAFAQWLKSKGIEAETRRLTLEQQILRDTDGSLRMCENSWTQAGPPLLMDLSVCEFGVFYASQQTLIPEAQREALNLIKCVGLPEGEHLLSDFVSKAKTGNKVTPSTMLHIHGVNLKDAKTAVEAIRGDFRPPTAAF